MAPGHNAYLHQAMIDVVDNQIRESDPPETAQTLQRLMGEGHSELETKKLIAAVVAIEIYGMLKHGEEFDCARYVDALRKLPDLPLGDAE
ncbi:MAG: hypothetical protein ABIK85_11180 [Candidatus Eisenbacteria bacterium]